MPTCETCRFMRGAYTMKPNEETVIRAGWCHRDPPTMMPDGLTASFRPIRLAAWCGHWKFSLLAWWRSS